MENIKETKTQELVRELEKREGIYSIPVGPHKGYTVKTELVDMKDSGPVRILVVVD